MSLGVDIPVTTILPVSPASSTASATLGRATTVGATIASSWPRNLLVRSWVTLRTRIGTHDGEACARPGLFGHHVDERCPRQCEGPLVHEPLTRSGIGHVRVIGDDLDPGGLGLFGHGHERVGVIGRDDDGIRLL